MKRYGVKPPTVMYDDFYFNGATTATCVIEEDKSPYFSGLYGPDGQPIFCFHETVPMGFHNHG